MKSIYLVRHGEYSNPRNILPGRLPVELSDVGKQQINQLSVFFSDKKIERIYSSAVFRCKQTSEILSNGKIPIQYDQRLLETLSAFQGFWIHDFNYFFKYREELGGESYQNIQDRMVSLFEEVVKKEEGNIIICSHGDPIYFLLLNLMNMPLTKEIRMFSELEDYPSRGSAREVQLHNGTITVLPLLNIG